MGTSWARTPRAGAVAALVGAAAVIVLGLLTLGVQASVRPHQLPLAVAVPAGSPFTAVAQRVATQGGDAVDWQVVDPARAAQLLDDKDVYGYLTLAPTPDGRGVSATATESGAIVPTATQVADGVLRGAGSAVLAQPGSSGAVTVRTVHPTSVAAKTLPLAAATLLWIGGLAGSGLLLFAARSSGGHPAVAARLVLVVSNAIVGTLVVFTFSHIWDGDVAWNWPATWFLVLVGGAFAALQGAVLRLLGFAGIPILGLLYLMSPSVSGQPPELLHPAYRALLWSWSPVRIATEAVRSLLFLDTTPDDVVIGWIVFGVLGGVALVVLLWPGRAVASSEASGTAPEAPRSQIVPALALEVIARRLELADGRSPALTAAAARLAPDGGAGDEERAVTAARTVLRPAAQRILAGAAPAPTTGESPR